MLNVKNKNLQILGALKKCFEATFNPKTIWIEGM
jgi:hypothetical protein